MNKLFLGLAIVTGSLVFAQETKTVTAAPMNKVKEPVRFGIKGGVNFSQFSEQKLSTKSLRPGFNAGVFVNIPLSEKFAIQPEVLYNQLGSKSVLTEKDLSENSSVKVKENYSLNYISVPLMLQMKPADNFYIEAGPEISYFINGKYTGDVTTTTTTVGGNTTTQTESYSRDLEKERVKKFNLGLGLGLGYYFTPNLGINARYVNSLTHVANNSGVPENMKDKETNRVFQVGLNYKF
ncbi:porin family protein [Chryseobacterium daeguense]|uniref:porin family protein n=1 Tax=Chryseobacterium daeguense TaxID=412438 RepID=UPI0004844762|nr:porin family protein [Chryseobacterium daeguense]